MANQLTSAKLLLQNNFIEFIFTGECVALEMEISGDAILERQLDDIFKATDKLRKSLLTAQDEEKAFIEEVNKKYGDGVLDPQTGIFKPSESDK